MQGLCLLPFGAEYRPQQKKQGGGNDCAKKVHQDVIHIKAAPHYGLDQLNGNGGAQPRQHRAAPVCLRPVQRV